MIPINIQAGEDLLLRVPIQEEDGSPIMLIPELENDPEIITSLKARIISGSTPQFDYELEPEENSELGELSVDPEKRHVVILKVTRAQSEAFKAGRLRVAVLAQFVNEDFEEGQSREFLFTMGYITKTNTTDL